MLRFSRSDSCSQEPLCPTFTPALSLPLPLVQQASPVAGGAIDEVASTGLRWSRPSKGTKRELGDVGTAGRTDRADDA